MRFAGRQEGKETKDRTDTLINTVPRQTHPKSYFTGIYSNNSIFGALFFLVKLDGCEYTLNKGDNNKNKEFVSTLNSSLSNVWIQDFWAGSKKVFLDLGPWIRTIPT